jgi:hypothetical protein
MEQKTSAEAYRAAVEALNLFAAAFAAEDLAAGPPSEETTKTAKAYAAAVAVVDTVTAAEAEAEGGEFVPKAENNSVFSAFFPPLCSRYGVIDNFYHAAALSIASKY